MLTECGEIAPKGSREKSEALSRQRWNPFHGWGDEDPSFVTDHPPPAT
jgi:hypothetical protein